MLSLFGSECLFLFWFNCHIYLSYFTTGQNSSNHLHKINHKMSQVRLSLLYWLNYIVCLHFIKLTVLAYTQKETQTSPKLVMWTYYLAFYLLAFIWIRNQKCVNWTDHTEQCSSTAGWLQPLGTDWRRPPVCHTDTRQCWPHMHTGHTRRLRTTALEPPHGGRA